MPRVRPLLVALATLAAGVARADTIFADGTLDPTSFSLVVIDGNEGGTATATSEPLGNPGSALRVQLVLAPSAGASQVTAVFLRHGAYDPMARGGFASIDYDEDHKLLQGGGEGQATGPALRQNGTIFIANLGTTPERDWARTSGSGLTVFSFVRLRGSQPVLNFSSGGQPIEVGFFRANAHPASGGGEGSQLVAIDNWRVALVPACTPAAGCDDGDACTTEACVAAICQRTSLLCNDGNACTTDACVQGICTSTPLACEDGATCTIDSCVAGTCLHDLVADVPLVQAKIDAFVALLARPPCNAETVRLKVIRKLGRKLRKARAKLGGADVATSIARIGALLDKAMAQLSAAQAFLTRAEVTGGLSAVCAADVRAFLSDLQVCVRGVPRR